MKKLIFQTIQESDLAEVLGMFKTAAERISKMNVDHWQYWKNPPQEKVEWVKDGIKNQEYFFVLNEKNNKIGMLRILDEDLLYWGKQDKKSKYVHSLIVKDEFAGNNLAEKILDEVEILAHKNACKYLRLDCDSKNQKLCAFYENLGFQKVGAKELPLSIYNLYEREVTKSS
ncbi:GNAT family N-acetyltransferase [Psychroflexus halocasei]|uniref:Acetyltransferase (GNAT) family protein n=1 Tax=Psychroflexus halocasei TaxID=908615 RepID=A0A1H3WKJ1_9FLAO|nr:GNAT family N-acetyltransferase [Psychroflexus halocasei]SDZ87639.1 Acetyltransferase (GNAT) family protein [Psychroflexus halocasei]